MVGARGGVPAPVSSFVGRVDELAELERAITSTRLLTLTGAGGCGKTRLALALCERLADGGNDVRWVDLAAVDDAGVRPAIARALGAAHDDRVVESVPDGPSIVVLDNAEHVIDAVADMVSQLLAAPDLRLVVTSRESLSVPGEVVRAVPPLGVPVEGADGSELAGADAVRLFVERASSAQLSLDLDSHLDSIAAICRRIDGLPLAIELAAARLDVLSPAELADSVVSHLDSVGSRRGVPERQRTITSSIAWSHDQLTDAERVLFRRLSVFADSFELGAAQAIAAWPPLEGADVLGLLAALVRKSLVMAERWNDRTRYRLLEMVRSFAADQLDAAREGAATRARYLAHAVAFVDEASLHVRADYDEWTHRVDAEYANLWLALDHAAHEGDADAALRIATCVTLALRWSSSALGRRWLERALAIDGEAPDSLRAWALVGLGRARTYGGQFAEAASALEEARLLAPGVDDDALQAMIGLGTGELAIATGDFATARAALTADVLAAAPDRTTVGAEALSLLAGLAIMDGDLRGGRALAEQTALTASQQGRRAMETQAFVLAAMAAVRQGDLSGLRELAASALASANESGDLFGQAAGDFALAYAASFVGGHSVALDLAERVRGFLHKGGHVIHEAIGDFVVALVLGAAGDLDRALPAARQAVAEFDAPTGNVAFRPWAHVVLAEVLTRGSDLPMARAAADDARVASVAIGDNLMAAVSDRLIATCERAGGQLDDAEAHLVSALTYLADAGAEAEAACALEELAGVLADRGEPARAARLLGAATASRERSGCRPWTTDEARIAATIDQLKAAIGEEYDQAFADGQSLDTLSAAAYAARGRGSRKRPPSGWDSLTPAEADVVALAGEGLTNDEIAARLFVSRNTVKTHLAHAYTKLGLRNRVELVAALQQRKEG